MTDVVDMTEVLHQAFPIVRRSMGELFDAPIWSQTIDGFAAPVYYVLTEELLVVDFEEKLIFTFIKGGAIAFQSAQEAGQLAQLPPEDIFAFWQTLVNTFQDPAA